MHWDKEFVYIMLFVAFWLILLIGALLLPRKQQRIMALSLPAVIFFAALFFIISIVLVLITILLPIDNVNYKIGLFFMMVLVAALMSFVFTRKYVFRENLEQAKKLLKEARAGDNSLADDNDLVTVDLPTGLRMRNLGLSLLPMLILFSGALLTRFLGHLLYIWPITVGSAIALTGVMIRQGWLGKKEDNDPWNSIRIFTLIIPMSMNYYNFYCAGVRRGF